MRNGPSLRGFTVGVLVGTIIGSAGVAAATFGMKGWTRFSEDFRTGYVNGFLDMANLARNLEPGGWVDKRYPYLPAVKPQEWRGVIDKLYSEPANKDYLITSVMQLAGKRLEDRYGKAMDPILRQKARSEAQIEAIRKRGAMGAKAEEPSPGLQDDDKPAAGKPSSDAAQVAVPPRTRKWCRCDGTDPKAAREKRRAEAAAAEAAEEAPGKASPAAAKAKAAAPAAPAKTPPNAPPAAKK